MEQTGKQIAELRKNANLTVNDIKEALALTTVNAVIKLWKSVLGLEGIHQVL